MATKAVLNTKGFNEYLEKIARAGQNVDEATKEALEKGAEILKEEIDPLVAVLTGNLKEHVQIKGPEQEGNFIYVEVGIIPEKSYTDAETARYANANEFGTSSMAAQPFIRPGIQRGKGKARKAMIEIFERWGIL